MTTMIAELYDALKEAGASEEKAIAAAKSIADYENHFVRMESKIDSLELKIESKVGALGSRLGSEVGSIEPKFGTKIGSHVSRLESKTDSFEAEIKLVKIEIRRIKWLLVFFNAGTISLIIKAFI